MKQEVYLCEQKGTTFIVVDIEENIQYYFYSIKNFPFCTSESKKNIL